MAVSAQYGKAILLRSFAFGKTPYPHKKMAVSLLERERERERESKNRAKHGKISTVFYKNITFSHGSSISQARINDK
jgi:hypothetical protein